MRLFIAITFNEQVCSRLADLRDRLKDEAKRGRFVPVENLHLTLAFLGQVDESDLVKVETIMDSLDFTDFYLSIGSLGRFKRRVGNLWWAGVNECEELTQIQDKLKTKLTNLGFEIDQRKFSPHITLAREVISKTEPRPIKEFGQQINRIDLMKSERIDGKLTYTPIYVTGARE